MEFTRIEPMQLTALEEGEDWRPKPVDLPVLYEDAWYDKKECRIKVVATEEEEWGSFYLEQDCVGPPGNHWLEYEFECMGGLATMMGLDGHCGEPSVEQFLMEHGIAPGQPFYLWMSHNVYKCSWEYDEWDTEIEWEVTSIVPWSREKVLTEWEAFYGRKIMMGWLD